jgi:hypothetical protein
MLTIIAKDGSVRRVNVHPSFYLDPKTGDKLSGATLTSKVQAIVLDTMRSTDLYTATLMLGTQRMVNILNPHNKPEKYEEDKIDERSALKDLKKDLKNKKFTVRMVPSKTGFEVINIEKRKRGIVIMRPLEKAA